MSKKVFNFHANLTEDENARSKKYFTALRDLGKATAQKGDAVAALIVCAMNDPEITAKVRRYMQGGKGK